MSGIMLAVVGGSYGSAPINSVAPIVTGTAQVGFTLTTTNGTWTGSPAPTFTYQWFRSPSTSIGGATSSTYLLVTGDTGFGIFCQVRATNTISPSGVTSNSNTTATVTSVPGAPTIGTATVTGSTSATVSYTAPANNGGSTITSYTATSNPGGITATLSQSGSGTISVTGLTLGVTYTFTVRATNAIGTSAASASSNSITTALVIGQALGGGYFAGKISTSANSVADFNLIVGPASSTESTLQWKTISTGGDPTSLINGPSNSTTMNSALYPAAQFCKGLTVNGQSDWYLPAKNELEVCYYNLKPLTNNNSTGSGINDNAVPARAGTYSSGTPAQTSATDFMSTGAEKFSTAYYWSSSQATASTPWSQYFGNGYQGNYYTKNTTARVRAIRRIAV